MLRLYIYTMLIFAYINIAGCTNLVTVSSYQLEPSNIIKNVTPVYITHSACSEYKQEYAFHNSIYKPRATSAFHKAAKAIGLTPTSNKIKARYHLNFTCIKGDRTHFTLGLLNSALYGASMFSLPMIEGSGVHVALTVYDLGPWGKARYAGDFISDGNFEYSISGISTLLVMPFLDSPSEQFTQMLKMSALSVLDEAIEDKKLIDIAGNYEQH